MWNITAVLVCGISLVVDGTDLWSVCVQYFDVEKYSSLFNHGNVSFISGLSLKELCFPSALKSSSIILNCYLAVDSIAALVSNDLRMLYLSASLTSRSPDLLRLPMASGSNSPWATIFLCLLRHPDRASKAWSSAILWSADDLLTLTESEMAAECVKVTSKRDNTTDSNMDISAFCMIRMCLFFLDDIPVKCLCYIIPK